MINIAVFYGTYSSEFFDSYQEALEWIKSYMDNYYIHYCKVDESSIVKTFSFRDEPIKITNILYQFSTLYLERFTILEGITLSSLYSSINYENQLKEEHDNV